MACQLDLAHTNTPACGVLWYVLGLLICPNLFGDRHYTESKGYKMSVTLFGRRF